MPFNMNYQNSKIENQYNIDGGVNINSSNPNAIAIAELNSLLQEIAKATSKGVISPEQSIDIEAKIKKAIVQSEKPQPDKQSILENINGAKTLLDGLSSAAGLIPIFVQAVDMIKRLF